MMFFFGAKNRLYIWDIAGKDHFNVLTRLNYYLGAGAYLIVFVINDKESFIQVKS